MRAEERARTRALRREMRALEQAKKRDLPPEAYAAVMRDDRNVLEIDHLKTYFYTDVGVVRAVNDVSFDVPRGAVVALVGESGCGKSVTSLSVMRLIQGPSGQITGGAIRFNRPDGAVDLARAPETFLRQIRGNEIGMVFQEPMSSLNPVFTIGEQIEESIRLHNPALSKKDARDKAIELLGLVGIARAQGIADAYPHELSGGMRQRVMIAIALACGPSLLIADEPTTALDVTIQAQILELLLQLREKTGCSILLITHDLGVVAQMADRVVVMYAGRVAEYAGAIALFDHPCHPYTIGLLKSKPALHQPARRLYAIPGQVPNPIGMPPYCYYYGRCEKRMDICRGEYPPLIPVGDGHAAACWLYGEEGRAHADPGQID